MALLSNLEADFDYSGLPALSGVWKKDGIYPWFTNGTGYFSPFQTNVSLPNAPVASPYLDAEGRYLGGNPNLDSEGRSLSSGDPWASTTPTKELIGWRTPAEGGSYVPRLNEADAQLMRFGSGVLPDGSFSDRDGFGYYSNTKPLAQFVPEYQQRGFWEGAINDFFTGPFIPLAGFLGAAALGAAGAAGGGAAAAGSEAAALSALGELGINTATLSAAELAGFTQSFSALGAEAALGELGINIDSLSQADLQAFTDAFNGVGGGSGSGVGGGAGGGGGNSMFDYGDFLNGIFDEFGNVTGGLEFSGGTMSNADILSQIYGGSGGLPTSITDLLKNRGSDLLKALGGGDGSTNGGKGIGGLLGALLGGAAGGIGANSTPAGTTTTVQDVPDWLKPYLIGNLNAASTARNSLTSTPGAVPPALAEYLKTINGDYLDPLTNPYLDRTYKHAADLVGAGVDSRFSAAGRFGSGAHQGVLQEGMNNLATSIFGGNYQAERGRQDTAVRGAPAFDTGRSAAAFSPYAGFADLFPASARATTSPYFTNQAGGILSGALAGSQLSKLFA